MARGYLGIRIALVCTVCAAVWVPALPAHADGGALGGASGGAVGDPVGDAVEETKDTVSSVAGSADAVVKDTVQSVRNVTDPAKPSPKEISSGAGGEATDARRKPVEPRQDSPRVATPQRARATPAVDTSSESPSEARARRPEAHRGQATRDRSRPPAVRKAPRPSPPRDVRHRTRVAVRGAQEVAAPLALPAGHPCASGSLAARALRQCAQADLPLPGLGGVPMMLPPAGLVLIGIGLLLIARGRRRLTFVGVAP